MAQTAPSPELSSSLQQYTQGRSPNYSGSSQQSDAAPSPQQNTSPSPDPQNAGQQMGDLFEGGQ